MNTRTLFATALTATLFNLSGAAVAVAAAGETSTPMRAGAIAMGADTPANPSAQMQHMKQGGMMGGGMMGGGMMGGGMMGGCPMMGSPSGPNGKVMMQMHGEMMRAMGDIMTKYADKFETPPVPQ